jgi:hypothetical protein
MSHWRLATFTVFQQSFLFVICKKLSFRPHPWRGHQGATAPDHCCSGPQEAVAITLLRWLVAQVTSVLPATQGLGAGPMDCSSGEVTWRVGLGKDPVGQQEDQGR